jgi:hypothetical protein
MKKDFQRELALRDSLDLKKHNEAGKHFKAMGNQQDFLGP